MKFLLNILMLLSTVSLCGQEVVCSQKDKQAFESKIIEIDGYLEHDFGKTIVAIGKTFLDTPYVAKTLEVGEKESLVINLHGLDCTTYVENVLAFANLLKKGETSFDDFTKTLRFIRYKDGILSGYPSRLHYFSEWLKNNEEKGLLQNITAELEGDEVHKEINFMSTHRDLYPYLKDDGNFNRIQQSEKLVSKEPLCILPQDKVAEKEHLIKTGDIIALATDITGLDVTHTGIAIRQDDGRIYLLHASSSGQVEISKLPLADYLKKVKKNIGILVARPV